MSSRVVESGRRQIHARGITRVGGARIVSRGAVYDDDDDDDEDDEDDTDDEAHGGGARYGDR
jgi:hypothetical protein